LAPLQCLQLRLHLQPKRLPLQLRNLKLPQRWHLRQSQRLQLGLQNSMLQLQLLAVVVALQELSDCQWGRLRWDLLLMWFLRCSWLLHNCSGKLGFLPWLLLANSFYTGYQSCFDLCCRDSASSGLGAVAAAPSVLQHLLDCTPLQPAQPAPEGAVGLL
jgi:hypothetical protein